MHSIAQPHSPPRRIANVAPGFRRVGDRQREVDAKVNLRSDIPRNDVEARFTRPTFDRQARLTRASTYTRRRVIRNTVAILDAWIADAFNVRLTRNPINAREDRRL